MSEFFAQRAPGQPGLALFLNAGDPPLDVLGDVMRMLDEARVDCLELAVPFPDSVTDGPVIRRSARRALANGVGLDEVLEFLGQLRPELAHLRVALFADWSYTVKPRPLGPLVRRIAESGADGLLLHALPPRLMTEYYHAAGEAGLPLVTTCYRGSRPEVMTEAAAHASAYLYLVAHYGRSGTGGATAANYVELAAAITTLRATTSVPIAVGFGVRTRADVELVHDLGADAAIVGTQGVARVERATSEHLDVVEDFHDFVHALHPIHATANGTV